MYNFDLNVCFFWQAPVSPIPTQYPLITSTSCTECRAHSFGWKLWSSNSKACKKTSRHRRAWCRWATIAHLQCIIAATPVSYSSSLPTILSELLTLCPPLLFSSRLLLARWRAGGHDSHPLKPNEGEHVKVENNQFSNCPLKTKWSLNESYGLRDMQLIVLVYFLGPITTRLKIPLHD